jgi:hypothetical protein
MKTTLTVIIFGGSLLMTNEASAQHHTRRQMNGWYPLHAFGQSYGYVPQFRTGHHWPPGVYKSYSLGRQSYPNPDRGPYPTPRSSAYF